jgi:hypothetical protein
MIERGGFENLDCSYIGAAEFIGLGASPKIVPAPIDETDSATIWSGLETLLGKYQSPEQGYTSRRAMFRERFAGDYDHLARFGEWDESDTPVSEEVK